MPASGLLVLGEVMSVRQLGGTAVALAGVLAYNVAGTRRTVRNRARVGSVLNKARRLRFAKYARPRQKHLFQNAPHSQNPAIPGQW